MPDVHAADAVRNQIKRVAPTADLTVLGGDAAQYRAFQVHNGVIRLGIFVATALALFAFLLAGTDRAMERRGNVASLALLGVTARTIRHSQRAQLVLPLLVGLVPAAVTGNLLGLTYLAAGGQQQGLFEGGLLATLMIMLVTVGVAAVVGGIVKVRLVPSDRES